MAEWVSGARVYGVGREREGAMTNWWTCPHCGVVVMSGTTHSCGGVVSYNPVIPNTANYHAELERIATALEKIAAELKKLTDRPFMGRG